MQFQVNDSKNVTIQVGDRYFARNAIQTHFVQIGENYIDLVKRYVAPLLIEGGHYGGKGDTPAGAVRMGDYKLIEFYEDGHVELYNLKNDISETRDLSKTEKDKAAEMQKMLHRWRTDCNAKMPTRNPHYVPV